MDGGGLIDETVVGVACGDGQTMAVTAAGTVYGWGCYKDKEGKKFFNPSPGGNSYTNCHKDSHHFFPLSAMIKSILFIYLVVVLAAVFAYA